MVKSRLDGPPELTEIERTIAHGKLLLKALYADHPGQRLAARRPSRCCWHSGWRLRRCLSKWPEVPSVTGVREGRRGTTR
jgi:hypothetical protein